MIKQVDHREPESIRDELVGYGWEQVRLPVGDYTWSCYGDGLVGAERKNMNDLITSFMTSETFKGKRVNKLARQIKSLGTDPRFEHRILIIEGSSRIDIANDEYINSGGFSVSRKGINRMLRSAHCEYGIWVERTMNEADTIKRLLEMMVWYQKSIHKLAATPIGDSRIDALSRIPGIGLEYATKIWEHGKSIQAIANMSVEELTMIKGIGNIKAQKIKEWFS